MSDTPKDSFKKTFNTVADGYDGHALRFFPASAAHMAALLAPQGHEQVLDVACGTGHASLAIAPLLPQGKVTAVDFSAGMLARAKKKAASQGIGNIDFVEGDMQKLAFPTQSFDSAVCAFGIFFVEEMESQLTHIATMVKPGGRVMITSFQESYLHPLKEQFMERVQAFGVTPPPQPWRRIASVEGCRQLFTTAGLTDIRVESKNVGYFLNSAEQWWDIVWNAGFRQLVNQLSAPNQERFKEEHLREVESLRTDQGIRLDVEVLFSDGRVTP